MDRVLKRWRRWGVSSIENIGGGEIGIRVGGGIGFVVGAIVTIVTIVAGPVGGRTGA